MKIDTLGVPKFGVDDLIELIYQGNIDKTHQVLCEKNADTEQFNQSVKDTEIGSMLKFYQALDVDQKEFDTALQSEWFMPNSYKNINIEQYIDSLCPDNDTAKARVKEELDAFKSKNMITVLKFMHFLVSYMRENEMVWGVGRGSSVASYVLFLLGVHKVDSIQYGLDWREFIR
jgi:DNA polymerase III alpha subunit